MNRKEFLVTLAIIAIIGLVGFLYWPKTPALVRDLEALPEVAKVEHTGPANAKLTLIHVRDWHYVPRAWLPFDAGNMTIGRQ